MSAREDGGSAAPEGLVVFKYGGAGLSTGPKIVEAVRAVLAYPAHSRLIVVSAPGKTTDQLSDLAFGTGLPLREEDLAAVLGLGERISARLVGSVASALGQRVVVLEPEDARWPLITMGGMVDARVDYPATAARACGTVVPLLESGALVVVCGFLGREGAQLTTLRRGGSDETAVAIGRALGAREVLLLKDVPAVFDADPKNVPGAQALSEVTPEFLRQMARRGGKIVSGGALEHWAPELEVRILPFGRTISPSGGTRIVPSPLNEGKNLVSPAGPISDGEGAQVSN